MAEFSSAMYFAVSNIPAAFRSANLRNFFSQFIESNGFLCFHYRHRPEILKESEGTQVDMSDHTNRDIPTTEMPSTDVEEGTEESGSSPKSIKTCCCVVSVPSNEAARLVKMYAGNQWIDSKGNWLARRCVIRKVKVSPSTDEDEFPYKTKSGHRRHVALTERFTEADLKGLPELNPPSLMPAGNVGTTVKVFLQLIQSCRLPPRLIRKLGLAFPKTSCNRRYGNVPFQYHNTSLAPSTEESVFTAGGHEISGPGSVAPPSGTQGPTDPSGDPEIPEEDEDAQSNADDDDDRCEEWERHEALHEDVTSQERSKERLYEEEIELKWEKGGSGLVFYTDAQYWQEEEGDFDEQTADDWDVDMSVYYDKDGGDMDSRDYVRMRYEKRLREGLEDRSGGQDQPIGNFEKFTKGVGRRVMEKQGWKEGKGLGNSQAGIPEALENEGQHPKCKRGFGYHGEKLSTYFVKKAKPDLFISTVYDKPKDIDQGDPLLRRNPKTSMKYRGWQPGGNIFPKR
ncbi:G patch domain-containing protein 3 isoform X1 [Oncorhynchus kisutch]|uniref:G patch domain containing 3 n=1 Tax=Oncorhynchus kisutch TaxID=8019 RepID=A0A8C7CWS4_ONCKI|nr:G patch domain-containing protein 3 isoform X1 [Oncorhynchus kisutch]